MTQQSGENEYPFRRVDLERRTEDDPRDRPRCDEDGTALTRVLLTLPGGKHVVAWSCVMCDEFGRSGGSDE